MTSSPFRPLDDVTENSKWRIRKDRPRVVIEMCWPFFAIFLRFWVIRLFSLTWKIPISGEILGVLGTPFTQKWFKVVKTPKRHFLGPDHVFWAIIRVCTIFRLTCRLVEEKKNELKTSQNRYISPLCGAAPLWGGDPKFFWETVLDDVIKHPKAHFDILKGFWATRVRILPFPIYKLYGSYYVVDADAPHGDDVTSGV